MSQTETGKTAAAEERTEAARSFIRTVKAATRRKYTPEEKIRIVREGFRREVTVSDLCRREGIKPHSYYSDVLKGRREEILRRRKEVQAQTIERRRQHNRAIRELTRPLSDP